MSVTGITDDANVIDNGRWVEVSEWLLPVCIYLPSVGAPVLLQYEQGYDKLTVNNNKVCHMFIHRKKLNKYGTNIKKIALVKTLATVSICFNMRYYAELFFFFTINPQKTMRSNLFRKKVVKDWSF